MKPPAAPATVTCPLTASVGTTTDALVPSATTEVGRTMISPRVPSSATPRKLTSELVVSPKPCSVIVCPVLAEAASASPACPAPPRP